MLAYLQTIEGEIMNKWQFMIVVVVALVAGLIGGVISDRLATAEGLFSNSPELRERGIRYGCKYIVTKGGNSLASAILEDSSASMDRRTQLVFYDDHMHKRIMLGIIQNKPFLTFLNDKGKVLWSAP
jgi:uncharacterized protein YneF (UPF0154 family)